MMIRYTIYSVSCRKGEVVAPREAGGWCVSTSHPAVSWVLVDVYRVSSAGDRQGIPAEGVEERYGDEH